MTTGRRSAAGTELATIEMTAGSSGDHTDANEYAVHVHRIADDALRALAVASVVAIDLIVWQRHS